MRRPVLILVLALLALLTAWSVWRGTTGPDDQTIEPVNRGGASEDAAPTLVGSGDAQPPPPTAASGAPASESPSRPWEPRAGFDLGQGEEASLSGRVLFPHGGPAPGALVWKCYVYKPMDRRAAERGVNDFFVASAKTDEEGRFGFGAPQLPSGLRAAALLVRHGDRAALLLKPAIETETGRFPDLVLGSAIQTRVDVVDEYGDPVPSVTAQLRVHLGSYGTPDLLLGDVSDGEGRLEFLPLPDRADLLLELTLTHSSFPGLEEPIDVDALRRGEVLRVGLAAGRTVRGRLVGPDGAPLRFGVLRISGYDPDRKRQQVLDGLQGRPDDAGNFELQGVPAEAACILLYSIQPNDTRRFSAMAPHVFEVPAGRHGEVVDLGRVDVPSPAAITGVVLGGDSAPIAGAQVSAYQPVHGITWKGSATTDEAGRFEIMDLPSARMRVRAQATFEGFGRREANRFDVQPGGPPVTLRMTGGSTLVVRFHPQGRPGEPLRVRRYSYSILEDADDPDGIGAGRGGGGLGGAGSPLVRLGLEPGTRRVRVMVDGYAPVPIGPVEILAERDVAVDVELIPDAE